MTKSNLKLIEECREYYYSKYHLSFVNLDLGYLFIVSKTLSFRAEIH